MKKLSLLDATSVVEPPGKGLSGLIGGNRILVTHRKKIMEAFPQLVEQLPPTSAGLECIILINDQYAATLRFHDVPREESKSFVTHLKPFHQFNKTMLVSGDRESEVAYLGDLLEISEIFASQTPPQKLEIVRAEMKKNPVLFMGDGINDAPALTAATVGIAFGQFTHVTAEAAGVVIMENSFDRVDELIHLSLSTRKIALQSAFGGMLASVYWDGVCSSRLVVTCCGRCHPGDY